MTNAHLPMDNSFSGSRAKSTRTQFVRRVRRVQRDVLLMGALVENSFLLACNALFERDLSAARHIKGQDKQIDRFYRQIELDCVSLLALQVPASQDLRHLSALMQLVRDLERIGDYAVDLGEIAIKLFPYSAHPCLGDIQTMAERCRAMLAMSLASLSDLDAQAGLDMKIKDDAVDEEYANLYTVLAHQRDIQGVVEPIVLLVLVIRHLERMADHATNIGKRVAYIVTGQR
ncbi:MAG: phosphate signaling complex protein PhoU [Leptolyngbyaceae bacterium]|nr:phosphate signaling complex protein PhoU [Leptolyngbyaceae bacterium]